MSNPLLSALRGGIDHTSHCLEEDFRLSDGSVFKAVFASPDVENTEFNNTARKAERSAQLRIRRTELSLSRISGGKVQVVRVDTSEVYQIAECQITSTHFVCEAAYIEAQSASSVFTDLK